VNVEDIKRLIDLAARSGVVSLEVSIDDALVRVEFPEGPRREPALGRPAPAIARPATPPPASGAAVRAPTDGVIHLRASPEAQPFVTKGRKVEAGETLCLIEVMKMFHAVPAPTAGILKAVRVKDGQHVEADEALFDLG
jgi:acetyl-CoA carboxylase biotin carboxyl carrier protein